MGCGGSSRLASPLAPCPVPLPPSGARYIAAGPVVHADPPSDCPATVPAGELVQVPPGVPVISPPSSLFGGQGAHELALRPRRVAVNLDFDIADQVETHLDGGVGDEGRRCGPQVRPPGRRNLRGTPSPLRGSRTRRGRRRQCPWPGPSDRRHRGSRPFP